MTTDGKGSKLNSAVSSVVDISEGNEAANFESAIIATGFGKFNVFLMLVILPTAFSQVFESVSMSYVVPVAQCDLNLTLEAKGMLNAITFAGMITSGFLWGYLCDVTGRKRIMVYGYLLDGFFVLMASSSQNFSMLLVAKFFGGFIINGPFSAATSYLSEFHSSQYRARVHLVRGTIVSLGNIVLPLLAWGVLPQNLSFRLFNVFEYHSWNVFLLICSLAPLTSGVIFIFMPESPKFLMSAGRNEEALEVFQKIYKFNTGKPIDTYPIKMLIKETRESQASVRYKQNTNTIIRGVLEGLHQIKPLFCPPNILRLVHVCFNTFCIMMSTNTLKLWLPQLFQAINDYKFAHDGVSSSMCVMIENLGQKKNESSPCDVNLDNSSVYINSMVVGITQIMTFGVAGILVNMLGKRKLAGMTKIK
ncbi:hypothetical protein NQ314_019131 [Rhamnusium bicolor]|uniref:Major facilitator superfamily (MFS) profile domain-containing protein n=1 Tax=Rhamnusium bicolor TaxID=1586634 RepID=A0AAV8WP92_9CUCU|nr:hypothetical protein NQ314_019131 [Rhamnusium bicolor]